jgi:UDPglucose 6-dehydrogenase
MSMGEKLGIVGQGFVGSAVREGLALFHDIKTYDINPDLSSCKSLRELIDHAKIIFVCLPTPMRKDGSCDTRLIQSVISQINKDAAASYPARKIVVVKSTIPPGTTASMDAVNRNIDVIFSPEFLTEANSFDDFKNQTRIILGGSRPATSIVKTMFKKAFPRVHIVKTGSRTAEMVKYLTNCFLATKVSFANEMKQICDTMDIDYDKVVEYTLHDQRLGQSHWTVPGPDGDFGFGGHCFPKDLCALIDIAKRNQVDPLIMEAAWRKNQQVRRSRDWEDMKGRAVSED